MLLTIKDLIKLLRESVNIQSEETEVIDTAYLEMTDEDIELFIKLGVSRAYPKVTDLTQLPNGSEYPIVLLAKIELYLKLAVLKANFVDMGADNNNYLKQSQRFSHYMSLVEEARAEYESWLDNEGQGEVSSYDVLLSNRHYTHRNYEKQVTPSVIVTVDSVTTDTVKFLWRVSNTSHFGRYKVYISKSQIIDMFKEGVTYKDKICEGATLLKSTSNIRDAFHSVKNLEPNTQYHVAVISIERNQVFGYSEVTFNTLEVLEEEDDVSVDTL